ncbi:MAG: DUF4388 domain-containing protein [Ktedonobacteraceae bacterium]
MSLIGSLEQLDFANILRRIEIFAKTGLLIIKQQDVWVEFYFRQGQLVCIGPVRANVTLIDRLLQANLLSFQALSQVISVINAAESNETRIALSLINEGYLSREILRAWAAHETSQVLQTISAWKTGEVHFEEDYSTPADRLLVALSISTLLDTLPAPAPSNPAPRSASAGAPMMNVPVYAPSYAVSAPPSTPVTSAVSSGVHTGQLEATQVIRRVSSFTSPVPETHYATASIPGSFDAAQLIDVMPSFAAQSPTDNAEGAGMLNLSHLIEDDLPFGAPSLAEQAPQAAPAMGIFGTEFNISASTQSSLIPPQQVLNPLPPTRIDTSFMTAELVLAPVDLSSLREQNPQVQLTPDQWRLFALIDGQSSLQALCSALMAPVEQVCMVAGELMAIGLIMPLTQVTGGFHEFQPQQPSAKHTGQLPSAQYASAPAWPQQPSVPAPMPVAAPMTTQAQWGNGNTGTSFTVGGGWIVSSKHAVPQSSAAYAPVGGYR